MAKAKVEQEQTVQDSKPNYAIQPWVKKEGFVANFKRLNQPLVVISKEIVSNNIDPKTGQLTNNFVQFPSKVFIDEVPQETYEIPATLDMRVIFALGQAKVIKLTKEQAVEYNAFAKKLHAGEIK